MVVPEQRAVLLNRMLSRAKTRAPQEYRPPTHGIAELLTHIDARVNLGKAHVFWGSTVQKEQARLAGFGADILRLRDRATLDCGGYHYAAFLIEFIDHRRATFPVVDITSFSGRDVSAEENERGAASCHVLVRYPKNEFDDRGDYRCAIEVVPHITRRMIEYLLSSLIAENFPGGHLEFTVMAPKKKGRATTQEKTYKYIPYLDLVADVARRPGEGFAGSVLSHLEFVKRGELMDIGQPVDVTHKDFAADLEVRVSGRQAPSDQKKKWLWVQSILDMYRDKGYQCRVYYKHPVGGTLGGRIDSDVDGAADLVVCPREYMEVADRSKYWSAGLDRDRLERMRELLDGDARWPRDL